MADGIRMALRLFFVVALVLLCSPVWGEEGAARFTKLDGQGKPLPETASSWVMVLDQQTGLVWEVKTTDGSIHDHQKTFSWKEAANDFIPTLNRERFGGYDDWRMPTQDELRTLLDKTSSPQIDLRFFPKTLPSSYWSYYICGDGSFITKKIKFGTAKASVTGIRARAVRTKK